MLWRTLVEVILLFCWLTFIIVIYRMALRYLEIMGGHRKLPLCAIKGLFWLMILFVQLTTIRDMFLKTSQMFQLYFGTSVNDFTQYHCSDIYMISMRVLTYLRHSAQAIYTWFLVWIAYHFGRIQA